VNRRTIVLGGVALGLTPGLAAASAPPRPPGPGEGLVYFYHPRIDKRRRGTTYIKIDKRKVADLGLGFHTWIYLPAGEYGLGVTSGGALSGIGRTTFPLVIEGGKTHYIRYVSEGVGTIVIPDVTEPPAAEALQELERSIYIAPKKEWVR
jgi:hypothetical protein